MSDKQLTEYAGKFVELLKSPHTEKNEFFAATLDDFLGALYALTFSKENKPGFEDRSGPIEVPVILKRAEDLARGTIRTDGKWLAGFHFNNALFRIAATYHRGLKVVSRKERTDLSKSELLKLVEPAFPEWKHGELDNIHREVNYLKHEGVGLFHARGVTSIQAHAAVAELLDLLDRWDATETLDEVKER